MIARRIRGVLRLGVSVAFFIPALALAALANPTPLSPQATRFSALAVTTAPPQEEMVSRFIVKPRNRNGDQLNNALRANDASGLAQIAAVPMSVVRPMSGNAYVISLDHPISLAEARVIAARLMRDGSVELAEPDRFMRPFAAVFPTDPHWHLQWNLFAPASAVGGADLPDAWGVSTGSNTVTVAVIDTGYRPHADLGAVLPGYTFITDPLAANNGTGRGAGAQDPGDWITSAESTAVGGVFYGCPVSNSSWHGTHVSGIIAAQINNATGIAGIAPNVQILPVRVLGKCGGTTSDIIDGMRWAAGLTGTQGVPGVPANANPAKVLNLSLGSPGTCSTAFQSAVTDIINAGKAIVVAAGNDGGTTIGQPANCTGVIAVTAHAVDGDNAWYATIGPGITLSAPGGGCGGTGYPNNCVAANSLSVYSLLNTGLTSPAADSYAYDMGSSMAAPHVTGVAALMLSLAPTLTPAQIKSYLRYSARPNPAGTICAKYYPGECGAGLLDAVHALNTVSSAPPVVTLGSIPSVVAPGTVVSLSGSATALTGRSIVSYAWTQQTPATPVIVLSNANTASASFAAPATGTYSFALAATDSAGKTGTEVAVIHVNSPPVLNAVAAQTVAVGQALNFTVSATDVDGDTPIFHAVTLPSGATLSATGNFSWPSAIPAGNYTMTYYASDPYANSSQRAVSITVTGAPVASSGGSGGGGSLDSKTLAALALLTATLRLRRRYATRQK